MAGGSVWPSGRSRSRAIDTGQREEGGHRACQQEVEKKRKAAASCVSMHALIDVVGGGPVPAMALVEVELRACSPP